MINKLYELQHEKANNLHCENKDADQIRGHREVDQHLCFRYMDSTIPLLSKSTNFQPLAVFCAYKIQLISVGPVRKQHFGFSCVKAHVRVFLTNTTNLHFRSHLRLHSGHQRHSGQYIYPL